MRPAPWTHKKKAISVDKINRQIEAWAAYIGLADWNIAFSPERVDKDCRSNVDIAVPTRTAAIRIRSSTPTGQWDRQITHELIHVLLAVLEDPFNQAVAELHAKARTPYARMWNRGEEWVIERLVDIIVGVPRAEYDSGRIWRTAFPGDV